MYYLLLVSLKKDKKHCWTNYQDVINTDKGSQEKEKNSYCN